MAEVLQLKFRIEFARIIDPAPRLCVHGGHIDRDVGDLRGRYERQISMRRLRRRVLVDVDRPSTVGSSICRHSGRPMDRSHSHSGIRRRSRRIKSRILDVVAHQFDPPLSEGLDVEESTTMRQPELAVLPRIEIELKIHELRRGTNIELHVLETPCRHHRLRSEVLAACAANRSDSLTSTRLSKIGPVPPRQSAE